MGRDEPAAAGVLVRDAVARWPEDARLRELQGDLDLLQGNGGLAEVAYEKAIRLDPANRALVVKVARSLLQQRRNVDVLRMSAPTASDSVGIRAGLALVALEARLGLSAADFRGLRGEAEALWRLASAASADAELRDVAARLAELAGYHESVEAGRQHAQCRIATDALAAERDIGSGATPEIIRVGPRHRLRRPSEAAAVAVDGSVVEIEAETYAGDVAVWTQNRLTLRGTGGRPHLRAQGRTAEDKGIWVLKGDNTTVENIEFSGARGRHGNGSGIRLEGSHLIVRDSVFHDNQNGILTTNNTPDSEILISRSEFYRNTVGGEPGQIHNFYIGRAGRFTLEYSYVHSADFGHNVKSRARVNRIRYNRIADGEEGRSSYLIDLPEGGDAEIIGNELHKGPFAENRPIISFAAEASRNLYPDSTVRVAYNTFYNVTFEAIALKLGADVPAMLVNNLFAGAPVASIVGNTVSDRNTMLIGGGMVDPRALDFRLTPDSPAVDAAVDSTAGGETVPVPEFEYVHPRQGQPRQRVWRPDMGAHEFCRQDLRGQA